MSEHLVIKVADIKEYLANGVTRLKNDKNYHPEKRSIEEIYSLTPTEVRDLFKEESLKGVRVVPYVPKRWVLVEEEENINTTGNITEEINETQPIQEEVIAEESNTPETLQEESFDAVEDTSSLDEAF